MSAAAVAAKPAENRYACYGRIYRVERAGASGMWWGAGRARGERASFLDKLGPRATREAMQEALDGWAARRGLRPLREGGGATGNGQRATLNAQRSTPNAQLSTGDTEPETRNREGGLYED